MLELSSQYAPAIPFMTRQETELELDQRKEFTYVVTPWGLLPLGEFRQTIRNGLMRGFQFPSQDFGWITSSIDGPPATRKLSRMLKLCGAQPACEHDDADLLSFRFWFDVSSEKNVAYCELVTGQLVEQSRQVFHMAVLCDRVDRTVLGNIRKIDRELTTLAKQCGIPTHPSRRRFGD